MQIRSVFVTGFTLEAPVQASGASNRQRAPHPFERMCRKVHLKRLLRSMINFADPELMVIHSAWNPNIIIFNNSADETKSTKIWQLTDQSFSNGYQEGILRVCFSSCDIVYLRREKSKTNQTDMYYPSNHLISNVSNRRSHELRNWPIWVGFCKTVWRTCGWVKAHYNYDNYY